MLCVVTIFLSNRVMIVAIVVVISFLVISDGGKNTNLMDKIEPQQGSPLLGANTSNATTAQAEVQEPVVETPPCQTCSSNETQSGCFFNITLPGFPSELQGMGLVHGAQLMRVCFVWVAFHLTLFPCRLSRFRLAAFPHLAPLVCVCRRKPGRRRTTSSRR